MSPTMLTVMTRYTAAPGAAELCNGLDDNCNGEADDDLVDQPADFNTGVCAGATKVCGVSRAGLSLITL